jgi:hypothetical protein
MKKRNKWTHDDKENLVLLNFIISLSFIRLLCCTYKLVFRVHAWLMHSVNCIEGNFKSGVKFWGAIADSYNSTTEVYRHRTAKNLKDHWVVYNKQVSLLNQIYNQESLNRQSGADDDMILEIAKQQFKNRIGAGFMRFHWWEVVRYQPKWRARSDAPSTMDAFVYLSEAGTEEEVTRPIDRDRAKTTMRKEKGKEDLSSQSGSSLICGIMSTLNKLDTSFTMAQMWKQYNKLRMANTVDIDVEELTTHQEALRLIKKDLNFVTQNTTEVQHKDDE